MTLYTMLSIDKIFFWLLMFVVVVEIPALNLLKFSDELTLMLFLLVIALDLVVNRNLARYKTLLVFEGVLLFYFVFSIFFRHYNTPAAITNDFILEQKAFVPFLISYALAPSFSQSMKKILKAACIVTAVVLAATFASGLTDAVLGHMVHYGTISLSMSLLYLYCSLDDDGKVSPINLAVALAILSVGLLGTRSKFYGEFVIALFMLFVYRPGIVRNLNIKHAIVLLAGFALVILVAWQKIEFYFIFGNATTVSYTNISSFARPALYIGMYLILCDYPIFGSGLASFANHSSSPLVNYSGVYPEYGLDKVWGLSYDMPDFISDAYYPVLAQFGLIGIALYIYFWTWIWRKLRIALHLGHTLEFSIGVIAICFALIESTTGTAIIQIGGYVPMMLLGLIVGKYRTMSKKETEKILKTEYIQK